MVFNKTHFGSITICGDLKFRNTTVEALKVLEHKLPNVWNFVTEHIAFICKDNTSGVFSWSKPALCIIRNQNIGIGKIELYAARLAHEAYHVYLYHSSKKRLPNEDMSADECSGENTELKCLEFERNVLNDLKIPVTDIPTIKDLMDSKWWEVPWNKQNW